MNRPWFDRIFNMLGEKNKPLGYLVCLTGPDLTFIRSVGEEFGTGGLLIATAVIVKFWLAAQQAAFLVFAWDQLRVAVKIK